MVVVSPATLQLIEGYFVCRVLGVHIPDKAAESLVMYQVCQESEAQSRLDVALATGLTPFVGREHEVGLLRERWAQSKAGRGQVVVLSGEAGMANPALSRCCKNIAGKYIPSWRVAVPPMPSRVLSILWLSRCSAASSGARTILR